MGTYFVYIYVIAAYVQFMPYLYTGVCACDVCVYVCVCVSV